jgi:hypothetical protein
MKLRGSEVQDFLRCRQRWDYKWNQKLVPKAKNDKLLFGVVFHLYLEKLYRTKSHENAQAYMLQALDDNYDAALEMEDLEDKLRTIGNNYFEKYKMDFISMEIVGIEVEFSIPLTETTDFTGTIDMIFLDEQNNLWFMDHKTTNSIEKYEKNAILDRQINRYWWAIQQLSMGNGEVNLSSDKKVLLDKPYGFIYNIIYKDYPVAPKILKNGGLSKDKNQKTNILLYKQAIQDYNLNTADYEDMLSHLTNQNDKYFSRVMVHRNQNEIDATMNEIKMIVNDIEKANVYRNITTDCHWDCQYKDLCLAEIDGSDSNWLKDELYEKGEKENDTID